MSLVLQKSQNHRIALQQCTRGIVINGTISQKDTQVEKPQV